GTVTLLPDEPHRANGTHLTLSPDVIGAKAYNLGVVRSLGFHVPEFEVVTFATLQQATGLDGDGVDLAARTVARLGLAPGETMAVRSSAIGEDGATGSLAG